MTPQEAENFYEDDEDPQKIFARFDAARQIGRGITYIRERYGDGTAAPGWYERGGVLPPKAAM